MTALLEYLKRDKHYIKLIDKLHIDNYNYKDFRFMVTELLKIIVTGALERQEKITKLLIK